MDTLLLLTFLIILGIVLWALLGKGGGKRKDEDESTDKLYRRRTADKEIEDEFPDEKKDRLRRKDDVQTDVKEAETSEDFKLPYLVDDIISERSRFKVYKRTIINSEIYARKGDFNTAISLYQGINKRINDKNVNSKISANIDYLKTYRTTVTEKKKETVEKEKSGAETGKGSEIKFTIDGPLKIPEKIQIDLSTIFKGKNEPKIDLEKMADEIVGKLVEKNVIPSESDKLRESYESQVMDYQEEIGRLKETVNRLEKSKTAVKSPDEARELRDDIQPPDQDLTGESETGLAPVLSEKIAGRMLNKIDDFHSEVSNLKEEMKHHQEAGTPEQITGKALSQVEGFQPQIKDLKDGLNQFTEAGLPESATGSALNQIEAMQTRAQNLKDEMTQFAKANVPAGRIIGKALPQIEGLQDNIQDFKDEIQQLGDTEAPGTQDQLKAPQPLDQDSIGESDTGYTPGAFGKIAVRMLSKIDGLHSEVSNLKEEMKHHQEAGTPEQITGKALSQVEGFQPKIKDLKDGVNQFTEAGIPESAAGSALNQIDAMQTRAQNLKDEMTQFAKANVPAGRIIGKALPQIEGLQDNIQDFKDEIQQLGDTEAPGTQDQMKAPQSTDQNLMGESDRGFASSTFGKIAVRMLSKIDGLHSEVSNLKEEMKHHQEAGTPEKITGKALSKVEGFQPQIKDLKDGVNQFTEAGLPESAAGSALNQIDEAQTRAQSLKDDMTQFAKANVPAGRIIENALPQIEGLQDNIQDFKDEIQQLGDTEAPGTQDQMKAPQSTDQNLMGESDAGFASSTFGKIAVSMLSRIDGLHSEVSNLKEEMKHHQEAGTPEKITGKALSRVEGFQPQIKDLKDGVNQFTEAGLPESAAGSALNQIDEAQTRAQSLKDDMTQFAKANVPAGKIIENALPQIEGLQDNIQDFKDEIQQLGDIEAPGTQDKMNAPQPPVKDATGESDRGFSPGAFGKIAGRILSKIDGLHSEVNDLKEEIKSQREAGLPDSAADSALNQIDETQTSAKNLKDDITRPARANAPAESAIDDKALPHIEEPQENVQDIKDEIPRPGDTQAPGPAATDKIRAEDDAEERAAAAEAQKQFDKQKSDIEKLQNTIDQLMDFKEKTEKAGAPAVQPADEQNLDTLKDVIKNLNDKIEQLSDKENKTREELQEVKTYNRVFAEGLLKGKAPEIKFAEEEKIPALAEARFRGPATAPATRAPEAPSEASEPPAAPQTPEPPTEDRSDARKKLEEKRPTREAPKPKPAALPDRGRAAEKEEKTDFELLSEYGKEDEEFPDASDELTDADIFEKILQTDEPKRDEESFEILGYRKEEKEITYGFEDDEYEKKRLEEEKFYRKFLRHERRKKKELPILRVSYDFSKLPDDFSLSRDKNILEYSFYKYKPLLEKVNELIKTRNVRDAINYYKVVLSQNIPFEFKAMLRKNINELTEYIEKYLSTD